MGITRENKVIRALSGVPTNQKFTPIATDMFLPNHSGMTSHPEAKKNFLLLDQTTPQEIFTSNASINKTMWFFEDQVVPSGGDAGKLRPGLTPKYYATGDSGAYNNIGFLKGGMFLIPGDTTTQTYLVLANDVAYTKSWGLYAYGVVVGKENMLEIYPAGSLTAPMVAITGATDGNFASKFVYVGNDNPLTTHVGNICPAAGAVRILGTAAQSIQMGSPANGKTVGNNLTIQAGTVFATGATDKSGGTMIVSGGVSSGTGTSSIQFNTATAGITGATLRTPTTKWTIDGVGNLSNLSDTYKIILGGGNDMSLVYDGTNGIIDTSLIAASDLQISCGTDKTLVLTESVYNDANVGGLVLRTGGTAPGVIQWLDNDGDNTGIYTVGFDINEQGSGSIEVPHDYKQGTNLVFHIHYGINDAPTGTDKIRFDLIYNVQRDGTTFVDATTIDSGDITVDTQYKTGRIDFTAITGTNFLIGDQFNFTIKRTTAVGDAYAGEVLTQTLGFHYECDTLGSRQIGTK